MNNERGQPVLITATGGRVNYTLRYGYKLETAARTNMTLALGGLVTRLDYTYDFAGRLTGVKPSFTNSGFTYVWLTNADVLASVAYPNGAGVQYAYASNTYRLASMTNRLAGGAILSRYDYLYNSVDQCTNFSRLYESRNATYLYEQRQRKHRKMERSIVTCQGMMGQWICELWMAKRMEVPLKARE